MDTSECSFLVSCLGDLRAVIGVYPITCLLSFVASFVLMSEIFSSHSVRSTRSLQDTTYILKESFHLANRILAAP